MSETIDLTPARLTLASSRGDTLQLTLAFWEDAAHTVAVDLTTATTITMDVKKDRNGAVKLALSLGDGLTIAGAGDNQLVVFKNHSLLPGKYVADLELAFPGSIVRTYVEIDWTVSNDVTRA